jgi:pimeloyl-ACP methyl ester carboxylesterase
MDLEANGTSIHYESTGSGPLLLLIHGIGGSGQDWENVLPRLAERFTVVTPDVRGFGRSAKPAGPYSASLWAADMAAVLASLTTAPTAVLGHSMGGVIAQRLMLDFPDQVRAAILVSTSSEVKEAASQFWEKQADDIEANGLGQMVTRRQASYTDEFKAAHPEVLDADERRVRLNEPAAYAAAARAVARYNFTAELRGVDKPVLIIQGLDDTQTPPGGSVIMSRAIPGARLEMLEKCGHGVHNDQPDRFVALVTEFMDSLSDDSGAAVAEGTAAPLKDAR